MQADLYSQCNESEGTDKNQNILTTHLKWKKMVLEKIQSNKPAKALIIHVPLADLLILKLRGSHAEVKYAVSCSSQVCELWHLHSSLHLELLTIIIIIISTVSSMVALMDLPHGPDATVQAQNRKSTKSSLMHEITNK